MSRWSVAISPAAQEDLRSVGAYYHEVAPEQVRRFQREVTRCLARLRSNPLLGRIDDDARHMLLGAFPYHMWYVVDEATRTVLVASVLHVRRDPTFVRSRLA